MNATEAKTAEDLYPPVTLPARARLWRYRCQVREGRCRLDSGAAGDGLYVKLTVTLKDVDVVPDVRAIEGWLKANLEAAPTTAEEVCHAAAERFGCEAFVSAMAGGHGPVEAEFGGAP
jgi:hypothetical protein